MINKIANKIKLRVYRYLPTDEDFIKEKYRVVFGKDLNLISPKTFNEKINWIICNYRNPLYELCSDKVNVHRYVEAKGLKSILIKQYAVYSSIDDIDASKLPASFVIKTTHASGGVCIVRDKKIADWKKIKKVLSKSMNVSLYTTQREWQYKNLVPRVVAEEYIMPLPGKSFLDYKIFCFDGEPRFMYLAQDTDMGGDYAVDFYDTNWVHLDAQRLGHRLSGPVEAPANLDEMLRVAKVLSKDFIHVRVDLYSTGDKIYFGELTFTSAAGNGRFTDDKWDRKFGDYMTLPGIDL